MFIHHVYFWTKPGTPETAVTQLIDDCLSYLGKIPTVKQISVGRPAGTPREVVDNSYAVALAVTLEDSAGHDVYQVHDLHLQFIARNKQHWDHVKIYDYLT